MAQAPEKYSQQPRGGNGIETLNPADEGQRGGGGLYQKYSYIQFRKRVMREHRTRDEQRVHEIYQNLANRSFSDYTSWMEGGYPLCAKCLEEGVISPGRVMDHITPIAKGGARYDRGNLQFSCDYHHNIKRATEDKL